jgi:hypothetical protein
VAVSACVQLAIHHIPATQAFFQIGALSPAHWALAVVVWLCPVTVIELEKLARPAVRRAWNSISTA